MISHVVGLIVHRTDFFVGVLAFLVVLDESLDALTNMLGLLRGLLWTVDSSTIVHLVELIKGRVDAVWWGILIAQVTVCCHFKSRPAGELRDKVPDRVSRYGAVPGT